MLSSSLKFSMRNVFRVLLLTAVVIYLLDAGVEASKSRKGRNKNRRSKRTQITAAERPKRTHGHKERRRSRGKRIETEESSEILENYRKSSEVNGNHRESSETEIIDAVPSQTPLIELVKAQQHRKRQTIKIELPAVVEDIHGDIQSNLIKEYLENRLKNQPSVEQDRATILPVIHADIFIKREKTQFVHESSTPTIGGVDPVELDLVLVHSARGKYGLHSGSQRIFGRLIHVKDAGRSNSHFGCGNAIANRREIPQNNEPWIALIERGHCAFFTKIKLAERNNASAAIIYDNKQEEIPKMNTIGTKIVSVAISRHDGHKIAKIADSGTKVMINIEVNSNPDIATTPDTTTSTTSATPLVQANERNDPGNGAKTNNGIIITTLLTALLASVLQKMTS